MILKKSVEFFSQKTKINEEMIRTLSRNNSAVWDTVTITLEALDIRRHTTIKNTCI